MCVCADTSLYQFRCLANATGRKCVHFVDRINFAPNLDARVSFTRSGRNCPLNGIWTQRVDCLLLCVWVLCNILSHRLAAASPNSQQRTPMRSGSGRSSASISSRLHVADPGLTPGTTGRGPGCAVRGQEGPVDWSLVMTGTD
ncbi:unnamed protein product [Protopolystoma xenopodis]|uniref:Uncharacterized protein n=1 Tax=Protopolystoma xenopodis TaxID=117903 RepID=A0A448XEX6_9PLAT|nr:unnamed protein product [Protopolystoma xenopodis]